MSEPTVQANATMTPLTDGYPAVVDDHYMAAIANAKQGGDATDAYFDALNRTSDFWGWLAEMHASGQEVWVPGVDRFGRPVSMASNGNVDMQLLVRATDGASPALAATDDSSPAIMGLATIRTGNTTTAASHTIAFTVGLMTIPAGFVISAALFEALIKPVVLNLRTLISSVASSVQAETQVESPAIDAEATTEPLLEEASSVGSAGEEAAAEGVTYLAVDWLGSLGAVAGLTALAAIPMVFTFLSHQMTHTIQVNNLTDFDFTWSIAHQEHGKVSVKPAQNRIPKQSYHEDMFGDKTTVKCAYQANAQFLNSSDFGAIGYVATLTPGDGSAVASLVVAIPWEGRNTIWVGDGESDPKSTWSNHNHPNDQLSQTATFGSYRATITVNKLRGTTSAHYAYSSLVVIEPV